MAKKYELRAYEDISNELQKVYLVIARAFELISLMYNRLTSKVIVASIGSISDNK
jgi:hypothetical protein